jgi:hypothetical protein
MSASNKDFYHEKATEMRAQACRAETDSLRALYKSIAEEWDLQADSAGKFSPKDKSLAPQNPQSLR